MQRWNPFEWADDYRIAKRRHVERTGGGGGIVIRKPSDYEPVDDALERACIMAEITLDWAIREMRDPPVWIDTGCTDIPDTF